MSAAKAASTASVSGVRTFSGWMIGTPSAPAATFTGGGDGACPRPAGRSGWLTTATSVVSAATARNDGTANAGEPKNTARSAAIVRSSRQVLGVARPKRIVGEHAPCLSDDLADRVELLAQLGGERRGDRLGRELARDAVVGTLDVIAARVARDAEDLEVVALLDQRIPSQQRRPPVERPALPPVRRRHVVELALALGGGARSRGRRQRAR